MIEVLLRLPLVVGFACCLVLPTWWLAGRLLSSRASFLRRATFAVGLSVAGYLSFVNLVGRQIEQSLLPALLYLGINLVLCAVVLRSRRSEVRLSASLIPPRSHYVVIALALVLAIPQALVAFGGWLWDESGASHIHLTAPSQVAENVFPPRHNGFPDVTLKYHYGTTLLVGTFKWLSGLSSTPSLDIVSTSLWLVIFLFVFSWLEDIGLRKFAAFWGSFATLLGGGLAWAYLPRLETYGAFRKIPKADELINRYDPDQSWIESLITILQNQNFHLRNADGTYSYVFLDIANFFQQHPVPTGMLLTLTALSLFSAWLDRKKFSLPLLLASIFCFSVVFLGHSVYGAMVCVVAGLVLAGRWLRTRTWIDFHTGLLFTAGVTAVAFLHGGIMSIGPNYGSAALAVVRDEIGFWPSGFRGLLEGSLASFGVPLIFAVLATVTWLWMRGTAQQNRVLLLFALFGGISFAVPQFIFYASAGSKEEQFTEIAKFFFCSHLGIAVLSAFGVEFLLKKLRVPRFALVPGFAAMAVMPLAFSLTHGFTEDFSVRKFRVSRYSGERLELARRFSDIKTSPRDTYFDASDFEGERGYLSELLMEGGSAFTLTPVKYEVNGAGFRLARGAVSRRLRQNSRMARLLPGAAEASETRWLYTAGLDDFAEFPALVRSRFEHAVAERYLQLQDSGGGHELYRINWPTTGWDKGIERHWRPSVISQVRTDWDGDGSEDLIFYDHERDEVVIEGIDEALPTQTAERELPVLLVGNFPGDSRADLLFGRMADTYHDFGTRIEEMVHYSAYYWSFRNSVAGSWQPEFLRWYWSVDLPLITDTDNDGFDEHLGYRVTTSQWLHDARGTIEGPEMPEEDLPVPFAGRFFPGSPGDLGLWSLESGDVALQSVDGEHSDAFRWGGQPGDVLVPADYDGDGLDEIGVWQRTTQKWFTRTLPDGPIRSALFGSDTSLPLPADYDGDGTVDLAYWEPAAQIIYVSFDFGESVSREISVPPNSIPIFVNMH